MKPHYSNMKTFTLHRDDGITISVDELWARYGSNIEAAVEHMRRVESASTRNQGSGEHKRAQAGNTYPHSADEAVVGKLTKMESGKLAENEPEVAGAEDRALIPIERSAQGCHPGQADEGSRATGHLGRSKVPIR